MQKPRLKSFWVVVFVLSLFAFGGCAKKPQPEAPKADLLIVHTNDTHSHIAGIDANGNACLEDTDCRGGYARIAYAIKEAKKRGENVLALDAGDMFQGTLFFSIYGWPMLAKLNTSMPWDAATLGNHEWDQGCLELANYIAKKPPFPFLAANLTPRKGCPLIKSTTLPYVVREIGAAKVGIIGLCNDEVVGLADACPKTAFSDRIMTVRKAVTELEEQGVKRIVLLTHIGLEHDRALARAVDGIDVIVGGHSHSYLGPGSKEGPYPIVEKTPNGNPVLVVTAKRATQYLGELACNFDQDGVLVSWQGSARELLATAPRDQEVAAQVAEMSKVLQSYRAKKVASHNIDIGPDGMDACRLEECLSGMFMVDALLSYGRKYGAQIALFNGGGVRASLPRGDVTEGDLLTAFPFHNKVYLREFTGAQIWEALEHGVSEEGGRGPRLLQVAGLRYLVDGTRPVGKRILKAEVLNEDGTATALRLSGRYRVVLPEYLTKGGDFYTVLTKGKVCKQSEAIEVDVLRDYLTSHTPLEKPMTGRILRAQ